VGAREAGFANWRRTGRTLSFPFAGPASTVLYGSCGHLGTAEFLQPIFHDRRLVHGLKGRPKARAQTSTPEFRMAEATPHDARRTGVLIKEDIEQLRLIEFPDGETPEDALCYKPASYDLRLGAQYVIPGLIDEGTGGEARILDCTSIGELVIEPFASVVVCTYEIVNLPANVVGKFNLRIKQAFRGLIVQMGTQVEPNYRGRLFALLQNITDQKVKIKYKHLDHRLFTIEFYYTAGVTDAKFVVALQMENFLKDIKLSKTLNRILDEAERKEKSRSEALEQRLIAAEKGQHNLETKVESDIRQASERRFAWYGILLTFGVATIITVLAPIVLKVASDYWPQGDIKAVAVSEAAKSLSESVRDENERLKKRIEDMRTEGTATQESLNMLVKRLSELEQKVASPAPAVVAPPPDRRRLRRRRGRR